MKNCFKSKRWLTRLCTITNPSKQKGQIMKALKSAILIVATFALLAACGTTGVSLQSPVTSSPAVVTAKDVVTNAEQWLTAAVGITNTLCQPGQAVLSTQECGYAGLAATGAQIALSAFKTDPSSANMENLNAKMTPVYATAKANANLTPAASSAIPAAPGAK
jgi:hypothetical protein